MSFFKEKRKYDDLSIICAAWEAVELGGGGLDEQVQVKFGALKRYHDSHNTPDDYKLKSLLYARDNLQKGHLADFLTHEQRIQLSDIFRNITDKKYMELIGKCPSCKTELVSHYISDGCSYNINGRGNGSIHCRFSLIYEYGSYGKKHENKLLSFQTDLIFDEIEDILKNDVLDEIYVGILREDFGKIKKVINVLRAK